MKRTLIPLMTASLIGAWGAFWISHADEGPAPAKAVPAKEAEKRAEIDLVLCLDTSNSMDGLIEAAKQKLWDIVNTLAKARPSPNLRVSLYSYGNTRYDAQKGWVRKEVDFTGDLDKVFEKIFALRTNGGEEYVARVCRDAIQEQTWSKNPQALRMIFVCGNEPANQDQVVSMTEVAQLAIQRGVVINTIYCGGADDADCRSWRELASMAKGEFSNINQGQRVAIATPFDQKLAEYANAVNSTYVPYGPLGGAAALNQTVQSANSAKLGTSNLAARVQAQTSAVYNSAGWDLVDKRKGDKNFDLSKVPEDQLPPVMRKMTLQERTRYIDDMQKKREAIQKDVQELSQKRTEYLRTELDKLAPAEKKGRFDAAIEATIRKQAEEKKIEIPR